MSSSTFIRKNFRRTVLASVVALGAFGASNSFAAVSASTTATSTVIEPMTITNMVDLNFGQFAGAGGGTVKVATSGTRSSTGNVVLFGTTADAALFDVTGAANATYSIAWSELTVLTHATTPANTMGLSLFSDTDSLGTTIEQVSTGALTAEGMQSIYLGGELTVAANQPGGTYQGTVDVTVDYN